MSENRVGANLAGWRLTLLDAIWGITLILTVFAVVVRNPYTYQATFQSSFVRNAGGGLMMVNWELLTRYIMALRYLTGAGFVLVGMALFVLRRRDFMAILISITLITMPGLFNGFGANVDDYRLLRQGVPEALLPLNYIFNAIMVSSLSLSLYLFPDGKFAPRWMRWTLLIWPVAAGLVFINLWVVGTTAVALLAILLFGAQIYRYMRVSSAVQQQQTRLAVVGILAQPLGILLLAPARLLDSPQYYLIALHVQLLVPLMIPLTIAISILRYRLWDIDIVVRRTLVYSIITVILGAMYFSAIAVLQSAFVALTGQESPLALVISTLAIAALFAPLRQRVQKTVDKRFYRHRYDAEKAVEAFAQSISHEVNVEAVRSALITAIEDTVQPQHVSLWIAPSTLQNKPAHHREQNTP